MDHARYIEKVLSIILYKNRGTMNTRKIGGFNEENAVRYLQNNGFQIIKRNYRCKVGEIDIIALKENILRFIEVKYRENDFYGNPLEAVNKRKQNKIRKTAAWFLNENMQYADMQCSFDVMAVMEQQITYIFNGFGAM